MWFRSLIATMLVGILLGATLHAEEASASQRGKQALLTKAYSPATVSLSNYENAWKAWGASSKPADFEQRFLERYGLHAAPYPNDGLPMGLRKAESSLLLAGRKGLAIDCLICHGGSIFGQSYIGLGNSTLDFQAFFDEVARAAPRSPFTFTNVRGTVEAGGMSVYLLGFREPDLSMRLLPRNLGLHDDLCEDVPAWWLLKKKKTMYYTGGADTRSVRSLMQFMMHPLNPPAAFHKAEADFKDIRQYLLSLQPPKYPLPIDAKLAAQGETLFQDNCARCHGTYGDKPTYPNKIVPLDQIGTDPKRFHGITRQFGEYYNRSWFSGDYKAIETDGYQAPPLDGIWATAPYLHNGSVPTLYGVLNSKARPKIFTRSYKTDQSAYDEKQVGWKVEVLSEAPNPQSMSRIDFRRIYDTTKPGRGNGGHTYGDHLSEQERQAVIEYLKTL